MSGQNALFGSYLSVRTPVHELDVRVKLICLLCLSIAVFATGNPVALAIIALATLGCGHVAGVSAGAFVRAAKPAAFLLVFGLLTNILAPASTADMVLGSIGLSAAGFVRGLWIVARMLTVIAASLVLCTTTTPTEMAEGLASLLSPLGKLGLPAGDVSMTISLVLRFIPMAAEELGRIREAQLARGARLAEGGMLVRLRRSASMLVPLVVGLFRRADELAGAMRERGWGSAERTRLSRKLAMPDIMVCVVCAAVCAAACFV